MRIELIFGTVRMREAICFFCCQGIRSFMQNCRLKKGIPWHEERKPRYLTYSQAKLASAAIITTKLLVKLAVGNRI
jgi:hypothetical protein